jgi:16S rRNA processing protein RimM
LTEFNKRSKPEDSQRGSVEQSTEPRFLVIGRILKPHGVRGEVRVDILTELPERFNWLDEVYVGGQNPLLRKIEAIRFHKSWVLLKLEGCDDRDSAALLRSQLVQVPEDEGLPLEEGEYFLHQLIGLQVHEDDGGHLGVISEVIETKANNVFVVKGPHGEILLPDINEVILDIDFEAGMVTVWLMPGLMPGQMPGLKPGLNP